jgi:tetratricopeptide (TPR) repeat protein
MPPPDPIQARLDKLHDQWVSFADDPLARLLVWRARDDEQAMVEAFVAQECDAERAHTPDLFLQLSTPWTDEHGHGVRLAQELVAQAVEAELPWDWSGAGDDIVALLSALGSLRRLLGERTLAVWLAPSAVHADSYLLWLQRLVHAAPLDVRFLLVGDAFTPLARAEPQRVRELSCALDMPAAFEALTDRAGGATPDHHFRRLQARLNAQLAAGELVAARETAERACTLAGEQGWPQLVAAIQLIMGAAFTARARHGEALAAYREADRQASQHADPRAGKQLRLLALFGGGGVLFSARAYGPASDTYMQAAVLAAELKDARSELEGHRMAATCSAELGEREQAWTVGVRGLRAAAKLPPEERATSTLSDLGALLTGLFRGDARVNALRDQLASLTRS